MIFTETIQSFRLVAAKYFVTPHPSNKHISSFATHFSDIFTWAFFFLYPCSSVLVNSLCLSYFVTCYRIFLALIPVKLSLLWYSLELAGETHWHHGNSTSLCRNVTVILVWTQCVCIKHKESRTTNNVKLLKVNSICQVA